MNLTDSCEEITNEEESFYVNRFNSHSDNFGSEDEYCNDPHCVECFKDNYDCSDPDVCQCYSLNMMKQPTTEEQTRNFFAQMMAAIDPHLKEIYKELMVNQLNSKTAKQNNCN